MQPAEIEQILVDIHAAKAFLDRVEFQIRGLVKDDASEKPQGQEEDCPKCVPFASDGVPAPSESTTVQKADGEVQPDLFDLFGDSQVKTESKVDRQKAFRSPAKGVCTLTRRQVLANFREIVGDRKILDLADVNRIFGYSKSTSGTFVKHAIKRGELGTIPYGAQGVKFLMIDVRRFIKQYFDRIEHKN